MRHLIALLLPAVCLAQTLPFAAPIVDMGASQQLRLPVYASVGALPSTGCVAESYASVTGTGLYRNSGTGTCAWAPITGGGGGSITVTTVSGLGTPTANTYKSVSDGVNAADCLTGGASGGAAFKVLCAGDGTAWRPISIAPVAGGSTALSIDYTVTPPAIDVVTSLVPLKSLANTYTGLNTFNQPVVTNYPRCTMIFGSTAGPVLTTGSYQPQRDQCTIAYTGTVSLVIVYVDSGASTVAIGYRHNGSTTALTPTLTPAAVVGITDPIACANAAGTAVTIEGHSVTCATLSNTALTQFDEIETIGGTADGTSAQMKVTVIY